MLKTSIRKALNQKNTDVRATELRHQNLAPSILCNYSLILPLSRKTQKDKQASLEQLNLECPPDMIPTGEGLSSTLKSLTRKAQSVK